MIDDIVVALDSNERDQLMLAFEDGTVCVVELEGGKFIAVNKPEFSDVRIIEQSGVWCYYERTSP